MRQLGSRTIKIDKEKLISKIKENKKNHITEYKEAVKAYKVESLRQLKELKIKIDSDDLDNISLDLTKPVNVSENYDKIIEMFEWELSSEVELSQDEFKEYVQDETSARISAKFSNQTYLQNI